MHLKPAKNKKKIILKMNKATHIAQGNLIREVFNILRK